MIWRTQAPTTRRYSSNRLPDFKYVPGFNRKPERHLVHELRALGRCPLTRGNWRTNQAYLYGIDLFNRRFFWEVHAALEELWHPAGRNSTDIGVYLQALIQTAAALLKFSRNQDESGQRLLSRARHHFARFEGSWLGLDMRTWQQALSGIHHGRHEGWPLIVLDWNTDHNGTSNGG